MDRALLLFALLPGLHAQVSLTPSIPSPARVGQIVTWTAQPSDPSLRYRFRVRRAGEDFRTVIDYGPNNFFDWTSTDHEGFFEIEVSVRGIGVTKVRYEMTSNITGSAPVVNATSHPLVFLYSAPACESESRMRVRIETAGEPPQFTPWKKCAAGLSMNFYLAGLHPQTSYTATHIVDTGTVFQEGPAIPFTSGKETILPASQTLLRGGQGSGLLLQSDIVKNVIATDLRGNLLWYYAKPVMLMTQPQDGGTFWAIAPNQTLREFDLAGMTVTETNVARVNEQLAAIKKPAIAGFHHEASRLPDGKILVLGTLERILSDTQGPGPVDIIGDMVIVMDRNLQVVWTWDTFQFLDVKRKATLGETCVSCATLAKSANDWTHVNSAEQAPDGNLLISARNQDFVYKVAYENGEGDGHVIWKLGKGGDFQLDVTDPNAWFSHQHDARYSYDGQEITLFDDGNLRQAADPKAHSRGQSLRIDETNMTAQLLLSADLGVFSSALGSAQKLPDGHYVFLSGFLPGNKSLITEVDSSGTITYAMQTGAQQYRVFWMRDLHTANF
ncbi:MAG: aryl-sulfate sulfotransferase [Acidobacteriia bacterium]|nr:aryl-sulfate sulfotransferase [Terriglobia bacterium]